VAGADVRCRIIGAPLSFEHLTATPDTPSNVGIYLRPGLWKTINGSVVTISRFDSILWGATVVTGGHQFGDLPGSGPGSSYRVVQSGAVVFPGTDIEESHKSLRRLAALSGIALDDQMETCNSKGHSIELLDSA